MGTMAIINLLVTAVLIALMVYGIVKKVNASVLLLGLGTIGLLYATIVNGSVLGEATVGLPFFDVFESIEDTFIAQLSSNVIILCVVMGYVTYMNHLKATDMMCALLGKPMSVFKKFPMAIVGLIMVVVVLMKWVVFSALGQVALVIATLYPIAIAVGASRETMCAALTFASVLPWGPANGLTFMYWGLGNPTISVSEYFMRYEMIFVPVAVLVAIVAFAVTSKYYDKKENVAARAGEAEEAVTPESLGIPKWYAIFPMLPILLVIIFSKLVVGTITISVVSACILCTCLVMVIELIRQKDKIKSLNDSMQFWRGFGDIIWQSACLVMTCAVFSSAISKIGGLTALFSTLVSGGGNIVVLTIICAVCSALLTLISGNPATAITLFGSILAAAAAASGTPYEAVVATVMPIGCVGLCMSPVNPAALFLAGKCNVEIGTILKRCLIPYLAFCVAILVVTIVIL